MGVEKMSVSFEKNLAKEIRREARREGISISKWLARAIERELKLKGMGRVLDEWEREHGAFTTEELAAADRLLWGSP